MALLVGACVAILLTSREDNTSHQDTKQGDSPLAQLKSYPNFDHLSSSRQTFTKFPFSTYIKSSSADVLICSSNIDRSKHNQHPRKNDRNKSREARLKGAIGNLGDQFKHLSTEQMNFLILYHFVPFYIQAKHNGLVLWEPKAI